MRVDHSSEVPEHSNQEHVYRRVRNTGTTMSGTRERHS